jgi:hypothetical protein
MAKSLIRRGYTIDALNRIEGYTPEQFAAALTVRDSDKPDHVPSEALVRLLRRSVAENDRRLREQVGGALVERLARWGWKGWRWIPENERRDFTHDLAVEILTDIRATLGIDYWEVDFHDNLGKRAIDVFRRRKRSFGPVLPDKGDPEGLPGDDGNAAKALEARSMRIALAKGELTAAELEIYVLFYLDGHPIKFAAGETDIIRITGRKEGTIRNLKTELDRKLKVASMEELL